MPKNRTSNTFFSRSIWQFKKALLTIYILNTRPSCRVLIVLSGAYPRGKSTHFLKQLPVIQFCCHRPAEGSYQKQKPHEIRVAGNVFQLLYCAYLEIEARNLLIYGHFFFRATTHRLLSIIQILRSQSPLIFRTLVPFWFTVNASVFF